jgi:PTH1 family peptidyl-tRNA hydrolase
MFQAACLLVGQLGWNRMDDRSIELKNEPEKQQGPFLIVGLGNPGREFEHNRHNVGFMLLNQLSTRLEENFGKVKSRALIAIAKYNNERIILIKPQTYMNESGRAVRSLANFYKVPLENLLVAYDDVDLPLGTLRLRPLGGSAGHKGMQSIIEQLGTEQFPRLRIGTGRPPGRKEAADYVLQDFPKDEAGLLSQTLDRAVDAVLIYLQYGLERAMNSFNG